MLEGKRQDVSFQRHNNQVNRYGMVESRRKTKPALLYAVTVRVETINQTARLAL